ncbi:cytochrome P450 2D10 [Folsomia candida]|uniref:cytochrome P450 2D10 n=1 Tax=Folsomia candida TaxID=158441 RepID=UPI000B8FE3BB|nr:cytochrome P450 2D10 [Folsomia candida]
MFDIIALCIVFLLAYILWRDNFSASHKNTNAPGPIKFPFLGNIPQIALTGEILPYIAFEKLSHKHGPIMNLKLGTIDMVVLTSLDDMNELLSRDETSDRFGLEMIKERNGTEELRYGIVICNGLPWKTVRRFSIQNLRQFGFGKKKTMEGVMLEEAKELISRTKEKAQQNGGILTVDMFFSLSIINALWAMVTGTRFSHDNPRLLHALKLNSDLFKATTFVGDISMAFPIFRKILPWITNKAFLYRISQEIKLFAKDIHDEHKQRKDYAQNPESFVDIFLAKIDEEKKLAVEERIFTEDQFHFVISELFQAGSETVNGTLCYALLFMILNPLVQKKVREEINTVVGFDRDVSLTDRPRMLYTQAVLHEVLRFGVIVPLYPPRAFTKDVEYKGLFFKKGTPIFPNYYSCTVSKSLWGDPEVFRPERFVSSDGKTLINTQKQAPFGMGKRFCMGETLATPALFMYFTMLLKDLEFSLVPGEPKPRITPQPSISATPYPFKMVVNARL